MFRSKVLIAALITAVISFSVYSVWSYGRAEYKRGIEYQKNVALEREHAALIGMAEEFKKVYEGLNDTRKGIYADAKDRDRPASPFIVDHLNRLPIPEHK